MRTAFALRVLLLLAAAQGCAYRVRLASEPPGAAAVLPSGRTVILPAEVTLHHVPFKEQHVRITAEGYRTADLLLAGFGWRRRAMRFRVYASDPILRPAVLWQGRPRADVEVVLVPVHEGVGTWGEQDVPGAR